MKTQEGHQSTGLITASDIPTDQRHHLREYRSWKRFHYGPRSLAKPLFSGLSRYGNCVLVAGCQRSGTTMLTRVIAGSRGFQRFRLTHDDELDAALILAGYVNVPGDRRYCFQTTYLNERYSEYACHGPGSATHLGAAQSVLRRAFDVAQLEAIRAQRVVRELRRIARQFRKAEASKMALAPGPVAPGKSVPVVQREDSTDPRHPRAAARGSGLDRRLRRDGAIARQFVDAHLRDHWRTI